MEEHQEQRLEQEQGLEQKKEPAVSLASNKDKKDRESRAFYLAVVGCLTGILVALVLLLFCLCLKQRAGQSMEVCCGQGCREQRELRELQEEDRRERRRVEEEVNKMVFVSTEVLV